MSYGNTENNLKKAYDNLWDASFQYKGQNCGIFPNSITDILVCIGNKDYHKLFLGCFQYFHKTSKFSSLS